MTSVMDLYRDDGPLAEFLGARTPAHRRPWGLFTFASVVALAGGIALDSAEPGVWSVSGVVAFILLNASPTPSDRRLAWLTPPLLRFGEYGFVLAITAAGASARPAVFALLAAVAFHHYDEVYRLRHQHQAVPSWVRRAGLGWDGRMAVVMILAATGTVTIGVGMLASWCAVIFVAESTGSWIGRRHPRLQVSVPMADEVGDG